MEKNKKNEELQSRREFFKKAAKGALPILGAIALAGVPNILNATEHAPNNCSRYGCGTCTGCGASCKGSCYQYCEGGCKQTCHGGCKGRSKY